MQVIPKLIHPEEKRRLMVHTVMMIPAKNFLSEWVMVNIGKEAVGVSTLFNLAFEPKKEEISIFIKALNRTNRSECI